MDFQQAMCGEKNVIDAFDGVVVSTRNTIYIYSQNKHQVHNTSKNASNEFTLEKKIISNILSILYVPELNVMVVATYFEDSDDDSDGFDSFLPEDNLVFQVIDKSGQILYNARECLITNPNTYLTHSVIQDKLCIFFLNNSVINYIIISDKAFQVENCVYTYSGMDIFQLSNDALDNLNHFKLIWDIPNKLWKIERCFLWSNQLNSISGCKVMACNANHLVIFSAMGLDLINRNGAKYTIELESVVVTCNFVTEKLLFITTDSYELYYFHIDTTVLEKIPSQLLPIAVEKVFITKNQIYLTNYLTGFYVLNRQNPNIVEFIDDNSYTSKEVCIFSGISHAYKDEYGDDVIALTDGHNSVLSARKIKELTLNKCLSTLNYSHNGKLFAIFRFKSKNLFYIMMSDYETDNGEIQTKFYINGTKECGDLKGLQAITFSYEKCSKNTIVGYVVKDNDIMPFEFRFEKGKIEEGTFKIDYSKKHKVACFFTFKETLFTYNDRVIRIFPGDIEIKAEINFYPTKLYASADYSSNCIVLYDGLYATIFTFKSAENITIRSLQWKFDDPIVDISYFDYVNLFFTTLGNKLYQLNLNTRKTTLLATDHDLKILSICDDMYYTNKDPIIIAKYNYENEIVIINYKNSKKNKVFARLSKEYSQISENIVETLIRDVKYIKNDFTQLPMAGVTEKSLKWDDTQRIIQTTRGIYMFLSSRNLILASMLVSKIVDIKIDLLTKDIMMIVKHDDTASVLVSVVYNKDTNDFEMKQHIFTKPNLLYIEPHEGTAYTPHEILNYRNLEIVENYTDINFSDYTEVQFLSKLRMNIFRSKSNSVLILDQAHPGDSFKLENVRQFFVYDDEHLILKKKNSFFLYNLKKHQTHPIDGTLGYSNGMVTWLDSTLISLDECGKPVSNKSGKLAGLIENCRYRHTNITCSDSMKSIMEFIETYCHY